MRISKELGAIFVLFVVFVAIGLASGGQSETRSRQVGVDGPVDPSVTNDRKSGSKAFFDWVGERGFKPQILRASWTSLDKNQAPVMVCIAPQTGDDAQATLFAQNDSDAPPAKTTLLTADDAARLRKWLQSGHTLILLTSRLATGKIAGSSDGTTTFGDAMDVIVETSATSAGKTEFAPRLLTRDTVDLMRVHTISGMRIRRSVPDGLGLFGDENGPVAESIPIGKGRLIVIADGAFASNGNIAVADNAVFLDNLLHHHAKRGDTILFDEYHHGDAVLESGMTIWGALGQPLRLALLQLLGAALLLAAALGARFGTPIPLLQNGRRTSSEYVESLSNLYQRAGASATALETIYRQFLRDVTGRLALPPDSNLEQLAAVVARRGSVPLAEVRQLLADCEGGIDRASVSEADLLTLVRRMDRIRKDLGIV
ncbi:hypothetical protein CCAX7_47370 [Capsulimonas corticalis]|uniref:DUF4350 domain-containing protein n=1 Tax=Capsulimonas corticalis TaxID=2219043 RepID=A0A402CQN6_9BACT|nr:DUF4350 domain-containing protein [Capsulimonas corticalis]BDI32686.1 hypothetical protein CCAX7_47370 [Capsulimonas corticalis]